ncbi:MAG: hypothetical protein AMXMBFR46_05070 [Acidimicrobiia bacterium]
MRLRCIAVGVDGSANAGRALAWALALAEPVGARVVAVHALGLLDRLDGARVPTEAHRAEIEAQFRTGWCAPLDDSPVEDERIALDGPPADVIVAVARDAGADVIVVGERGLGGGRHGDLGSTSHRVLAIADRPVLVVPEGAAT